MSRDCFIWPTPASCRGLQSLCRAFRWQIQLCLLRALIPHSLFSIQPRMPFKQAWCVAFIAWASCCLKATPALLTLYYNILELLFHTSTVKEWNRNFVERKQACEAVLKLALCTETVHARAKFRTHGLIFSWTAFSCDTVSLHSAVSKDLFPFNVALIIRQNLDDVRQ